MEARNNRRLREIKLSIYINHIDKIKSKILYESMIRFLSCIALSISGEANKMLAELVQMSVCGGFARATHKELYATIKTFFKVRKILNEFKTNSTTFYKKFGDVMNMDYINEEYLESLRPVLDNSAAYNMVDVLNDFIENFEIPKSLKHNKLEYMQRTLELDFLLIYEKLLDIFGNVVYVDKLIFNICNAFNIDYPTIAHLKNHIHIISRRYPNFKGNSRYLTQEFVTLYTYRGYTKGAIGSKILGKNSNYLFEKCRKEIAQPIDDKDLVWQYYNTIDWENLDKDSVTRFISVFRMFSDYDV